MTRISFIMPSFNRADYIAESIESVLAQMGREDELLVVDDGSTDGTGDVVARYTGSVRYVRQDNAGKSVALNLALGETDGEFVWICDDDDLLLPGIVERFITAIEREQVDMVFARYTRFRLEQGQKVDLGTGYWPDLSHGAPARHILEDAFIMHNGALVRRSAYDRAGPFDPAMLRSQDYEMFVRLALQATIAEVDGLAFEQRKHDGARGPAKVLHAAASSAKVWEDYDRRIFRKIHSQVPLSYFEGLFESSDQKLVQRAALLQRACIMSRHGLGDEAMRDMEAASLIMPERGLDPLERDICRRAVAGKHGLACLVSDASLSTLVQIKNSNECGKQIISEMADGLVWRLRDEDAASRAHARTFLLRALGLGQIVGLVVRRFMGRAKESSQMCEVERPVAVSEEVAKALRP